jgi:hypothetical protein
MKVWVSINIANKFSSAGQTLGTKTPKKCFHVDVLEAFVHWLGTNELIGATKHVTLLYFDLLFKIKSIYLKFFFEETIYMCCILFAQPRVGLIFYIYSNPLIIKDKKKDVTLLLYSLGGC